MSEQSRLPTDKMMNKHAIKELLYSFHKRGGDLEYCADEVIRLAASLARAEIGEDLSFEILEWFRNYVRRWEAKGIEPTFGCIWDMIHMAGKEDWQALKDIKNK